jgi:Na+-driven multidrug efflux pump
MAIVFLAVPQYLMMIFTHDPEVIRQGSVFLRIVAFAQIPLAISFVYAGSLRGAGDTFYVFIVTLVAMWGVRVLLAWIVGPILHLSLYAVWGVFLVDWYARAGAFAWRYHTRDLPGIHL